MTRDLEDLGFQIALSEGFHLSFVTAPVGTSVSCLAAQLVDMVASHRERSTSFLVIDPLLAHYLPGPVAERTLSAQILDPILNASVLRACPDPMVVVDGFKGAALLARTGYDEGWRGFFQRMNERRNAMAQRFPGALVFALPQPLLDLVAIYAPDTWSVRSGIFNAEAMPEDPDCPHGGGLLAEEGSLRHRLAGLDPSADRTAFQAALSHLSEELARTGAMDAARDLRLRLEQDPALHPQLSEPSGLVHDLSRLLMELFSERELRALLSRLDDGASILASLPESASMPKYVLEAVLMLMKTGHIENAFFDSLVSTRPEREREIRLVQDNAGVRRSLWGAQQTRNQALSRTLDLEVEDDPAHVSRTPATPDENPKHLQQMLQRLLPAQFEEFLFLLRVPAQELLARSAPMALRASDLVRWISANRGSEGLQALEETIRAVAPDIWQAGLPRSTRGFFT